MKTIARKKELGEVFTPPALVNEMLDHLPPEVWIDPNKTFIDPSGCGNGNFLIGIKDRLLQYHQLDNILPRVFGVDIMEDNCIETILRLYFNFPLYENNDVVEDWDKDLANESEHVSNNNSKFVKVIRLKDIVDFYFKYQGGKEDHNEEEDDKKVKELLKDNIEYFDIVKGFFRPGLLALFVNKRTNKIIETIIQADGLVYDYSFGSRKLKPLEIYSIRENNKIRSKNEIS